MVSLIRIMIPTITGNTDICFRGFIKTFENNLTTIYITKYTNSDISFKENIYNKDIIYGYISDNPIRKHEYKHVPNCMIISYQVYPQVCYLCIGGKEYNVNENCVLISYNHREIKNSETLGACNDYITELQKLVQNENNKEDVKTTYKPTLENPSWLMSSMFVQHLFNHFNMMIWLLISIKKNKRVLIKEGNFILTILADIVIGYFILELFLRDKKDVGVVLMRILEKLVNLMYSLLKWLMGSPAGLKLNNAFNKMLGKYFSYHIELWWLFLDVSGEKLDVILHLYKYIGYLGFTFQAAIISDMICIATFHSYCIYVYAARLFNIQISGLIALLRLFVGRKYNPLRGGIDSCEYTNQELFVGTVAFTILLLLLPTTIMYYTVFTLFRVLSMVVQYILAKCIHLIQTLPLYVFILWLTKSTKVGGNVLIEVIRNDESPLLLLRLKLFKKSLRDLVINYRPPVEVSKRIEWKYIVKNIVTGKQII